jgi:predicted transcriptional regulator
MCEIKCSQKVFVRIYSSTINIPSDLINGNMKIDISGGL